MKSILVCAAIVGMALTSTSPASAKGCIKGAIVGGIAGHVAGHHGAVGAVAGCVIGRHNANANKANHDGQNRQQPVSDQRERL